MDWISLYDKTPPKGGSLSAPRCLGNPLTNVAHVVKPYPAHVVPMAASVTGIRFPALWKLDSVLLDAWVA